MSAQDPIDKLLALSPEERQKIVSHLNPQQVQTLTAKIQQRKQQKGTLLASRKAASVSEFEKNKPAFEKGEEPSAKRILDAPLDFAIGAEQAVGIDPMHPITSLPGAALGAFESMSNLLGFGGIGRQAEALHGAVTAPPAALRRTATALNEGNLPEFNQGLGELYTTTKPIVEGAVEGVKAAVDVSDLKSKARNIAKRGTGQTAADTTAKDFKAYSEEAAEVPGKQKAAADEAAAKTAEKQAKENERAAEQKQKEIDSRTEKYQKAQREQRADVKTEEEKAATKTQEQTAQFDKTQQVRQDSARLGTQVKDLNDKLKVEADEKYQPVHDATAADDGETLVDQVKAAKNELQGSSESIKQFNEVLRGEGETGEEGRHLVGKEMVGVGKVDPNVEGHPLGELVKEEDIFNKEKEQKKYKFKDIKGYRQEIDKILASRDDLLSDVYNALTAFRQSLTGAMETIADRNGVGEELQEANAFYRDWKQVFTDNRTNKSAVGDVLNRVVNKGKRTDPRLYHEPFTTGPVSDIAIESLRKLGTRHSAEANAIADLGESLRERYNTGEKPEKYLGKRPAAVQPKAVPTVPPPTGIGVGLPQPETVEPVKPAKVAIPDEPNVGKSIKKREEAVGQQGREFQKLKGRDIYHVMTPAALAATGHPLAALATGVTTFIGEKALGVILDRPIVRKFIAAPTEADVIAAGQLPEPVRTRVMQELRDFIDKEKQKGTPIKVAPSVMRLIAQPAIIRNRRDALEKLGK